MPKFSLFLLAIPALCAAEFDRDVKPLLVAKCIRCHGGEQPAAGFDMTSGEAFRRASVAIGGSSRKIKSLRLAQSCDMSFGCAAATLTGFVT